MQITCPKCTAQYNVDESRIPAQGVSIKCPRCLNQFVVHQAQAGGVPLPGSGGAVPLPGGGAGAVPLPGGGAGAVPLPGQRAQGGVPLPGARAPAPQAAVDDPFSADNTMNVGFDDDFGGAAPAGGGGVPLPGQRGGGAVPLPGMPGQGAVPLPGMPGMGGGVPLPGQRGGGAVPLPGMPGQGAVPLPGMPGMGGGVPLPGQRGGGVPLPGAAAPAPFGGGGGGVNPNAGFEDIFNAPPPPAQGGGFGGGGGGPAGKAASLTDIFGDLSDQKATQESVPPHPFHGTNSVVVGNDPNLPVPKMPGGGDRPSGYGGGGGAGAQLQDDIFGMIGGENLPKPHTGASSYDQFRIRKRSGRVIGPFDTEMVLGMFNKGELLGSEEASTDGVTWKPLAQIPAFSETIQRAMASALSGLGVDDDLPVPRRAGDEDLPVPRNDGTGPADAAEAQVLAELSTGKLTEAEKAKRLVQIRKAARGRRGATLVAVGSVLLVVAAAGGALQFLTPYGAFGYKLIYKPKVEVVDKKTDLPPPPPVVPATDAKPEDLLLADHYVAYRQGADQAGRVVDAKKPPPAKEGEPPPPIPPEVSRAASEQARFLAYLVGVEDMPVFLSNLKTALTMAADIETEKAIAETAVAYSEKKWDQGLTRMKALVDPAKGLKPKLLAEMLAWQALGQIGKGDLAGANKSLDEALVADSGRLLVLTLQAKTLAKTGDPESALAYADKALAIAPDHPRASLLKGELMLAKQETVEGGLALLVAVSEGKLSTSASPSQRAQSFVARARHAMGARDFAEALKLMNKATEQMPGERTVRIAQGELALKMREFGIAKETYKKALELAPDETDAIVGLARAKAGSRDALGAYTDLQTAVRKAPEDAQLNFWFGVVSKELLKLEEAKTSFEKAVKLDPKAPEPRVELVLDTLDRGKVDAALKLAVESEAAVAPADLHRIRAAKSQVLIRMRDFPKAEAELKAALSEEPKDVDARVRYVDLLVALHRPDDAQLQADEAVQQDPKNPTVVAAAGQVLAAKGNHASALERFEEAMALNPNAFRVYLRAAQSASAIGDLTRAKGFVDTAGQLQPSNPEVMMVRGQVMRKIDPKLAARVFVEAFEASPKDPNLPYQLGVTYQAMGSNPEAIDAFKKAISLDPKFADAYFALGKTQRDLGRHAEARTAYGEVVKIDKTRADAYVEIADILATMGDVPGSVKAYENAIDANPADSTAMCTMGETLVVRLGDDLANLKRGVSMLERCVKQNPKHPSAWKNLGNVYKSQGGKKKDAIQAYRTHLAVNPNDAEAGDVQDILKDLGG